jgi:hypothetical protein
MIDPRHGPWPVVLLIGLGLLQPAAAGETKAREFPLANGQKLTLVAPAGWEQKVTQLPGAGTASTIRLFPRDGKTISLTITLLPLVKGKEFDDAKLKGIAEQQGKRLLATSKEKELVLTELKGATLKGYFYSFTDKAPKAGEWPILTQGVAREGDYLLSFTVLTRSRDSADYQAALKSLKSVKIAGR